MSGRFEDRKVADKASVKEVNPQHQQTTQESERAPEGDFYNYLNSQPTIGIDGQPLDSLAMSQAMDVWDQRERRAEALAAAKAAEEAETERIGQKAEESPEFVEAEGTSAIAQDEIAQDRTAQNKGEEQHIQVDGAIYETYVDGDISFTIGYRATVVADYPDVGYFNTASGENRNEPAPVFLTGETSYFIQGEALLNAESEPLFLRRNGEIIDVIPSGFSVSIYAGDEILVVNDPAQLEAAVEKFQSDERKEEEEGLLNTIIGALQGEFNESPTVPELFLNMGLGIVPGVGEVADLSDIIAILLRMNRSGDYSKTGEWVGIALSLIGLVPVVGGFLKGFSKIVQLGKLDEALTMGDEFRALLVRFGLAGDFRAQLMAMWRSSTGTALENWKKITDGINRASLGLFGGRVQRVYDEGVAQLHGIFDELNGLLDEAAAKVQDWLNGGQGELATAGGPSASRVEGPDVDGQVMRSQSEGPTGEGGNYSTASSNRLVNVIEEEPSPLGRTFGRYDVDGNETFGARLLNNTGTLQIAWTDNVRQLASNIAEVQNTAEVVIDTITGYASDGIETLIREGRFNSALYEQHLSRRLGGQWSIELVPKGDTWDIFARRR